MLYVSFSLIIIFMVCLISSTAVLWYNSKKPLFVVWSLLSYFISFWALGFYLTISASDFQTALFWGRFHNLVAMFCAPLFLHFSCLLLDKKSKFIRFSYTSTILLLILALVFSDSFIPTVKATEPFDYYIRGGVLHMIFFVLYILISSTGVANLLLAAPKSDGFKRKQLIYILTAYAFGFTGGATTFPMCYGIDLYPFGVAGVIVYIPLISYTLLNHKFLEISVLVSKGIAKVMTIFLLALVYLLAWYIYEAYMVPNTNVIVLFNLTYLVIACESYQWLRNKVKRFPDNLIIKRDYNLNFVCKELSSILVNAVEPESLIKQLEEYFRNRLNFADFTFYVEAKLLQTDDSGLVKYGGSMVADEKAAIEELRVQFVMKPALLFIHEAKGSLQRCLELLDGKVAVPFISERNVLGVLLVNPREGDAHFSSDDFTVFKQMVEQIGSSLARIQAHINVTNAVRSLAGSIAHEMRNPLGQLGYSLDEIQNNMPIAENNITMLKKETLDSIFEELARGQNAVKRGLQIIDMTLDEVKGKVINPDTFVYLSSLELTSRAVNEYCYADKDERDKVKVICEEDFYFRGDETMFQLVVFNLLKNALYYFRNKSKGLVQISIKTNVKANYNAISIADNGPGIKPAKLAKLFENFYTSGKKEGTGLGLAYCKRVMKSFKGDIDCQSVSGQGATFTLYLPIVSKDDFSSYKNAVSADVKSKIGGKHFLVVDDQEANRVIVRAYFETVDISISEAVNGVEAINKLKMGQYDGVIMDLSMPVMGGLEAVERIRAGEAGYKAAAIPIIAFTAENVYYASIKCDKVGCDGFITKPAKVINFLEIVADVLCRHRDLQENPDHFFENKRVLIADDDAINRLIVRKILEEMKIYVIEAHDGTKVLEIFKAINCDLIIMDIQMPGMDGLETVKRLKKLSDKVSVVALSGYSGEDMVAKAMQAGMDDYLVKPINRKVLYRKLRKYLTNSLTEYDMRVPVLTEDDNFEILDVEHLKTFESIGVEFIQKFGTLFPANSQKIIKNIEEAYDLQDLQKFERATHALKGCAANIGARKLHMFCAKANDGAVQKMWPAETNWLRDLSDLNEQTEQALKAYIARYTALNSTEPSS